MKLNDLFEEMRFGKEAYEVHKSTDQILESYDADYNYFFASRRVSTLLSESTTDESTTLVLKRFVDLFEEIENRETTGKYASPAFYKLRLMSLTEGYNKLVNSFENKKFHHLINKESFGKILGTIQYVMEEVSAKAGSKYIVKDTPVLLKHIATDEKELIESIVN